MTGFVIRAKELGGESIVWRPEVCGENATPLQRRDFDSLSAVRKRPYLAVAERLGASP
jgi:hypothetical protein